MRHIKIRMGLCGLLAGMALVFILSALFTLAGTDTGLGGTSALAAEAPADAYLLTDHQGYLCVYDLREEPAQLMTVTDIRLATLRQEDQAALESGISVKSREELLILLEDFGS